MPPTEPAPYAPTIADIERRDDDARKRQAAYLDELRAVAQKARAEGRDRERERVIRILEALCRKPPTTEIALAAGLAVAIAAIRTGKAPDR